ncbi:permease for cytosine/purines uracil thiamine allantoin [Pseudohyphozyma bogoriensis]|nr:permease for cytosine/purines uracil thiamine allantoin [Pseudohyphozyma bogoriensis]
MSLNSERESKEDLERGAEKGDASAGVPTTGAQAEAEVNPHAAIERRFGGGFARKLFSMGVEARGIERVPESERVPKGALNNMFMWFSVNSVLTTVPIGVLGQEFFTLTLPHAIATILCFGALGCATTAFIATLGPKTGLRTMVITRYSGGKVGGFIFSVLNILTQLGFSVTCVILGGQTLGSINNTVPLAAGVVIVSVCSLAICFFGYNLLHIWERYAWIGLTVIFCMLYGLGSEPGYDLSAQKAYEDTGRNLAGDILSFGGVIFGSAAGWAPVAADFNVKLPANTSSWRVFWLTWIGLFWPICFVEILGAALMTITNEAYTSAFETGGTGALLAQTLSPWGGFGKFILVVLSLSVISNNVPNTYSAALSIQALWQPLQKIPRFAWTVVVAIIYMVAGIAGREHFSAILSNLLSILSYWTAFFVVILAEEHFIFRRPGGKLGGYDLEGYNDTKRLPPGFACVFAICCGIAGAVVGMAETYYIGPIALKIASPYGGDLGFELAAVFAGISFPIARHFEIKMFGR